MRRLELHYQEHQQHNSLYQECQDWAERTRDKLNECSKPITSFSDAQSKLQSVKALRQSLETGQNKLRYTLELKEKVILNTEKTGAAKIQEDTENLKAELDRLFSDVDELRMKLGNQVSQLEDFKKNLKMLTDWLDETESKAKSTDIIMSDLGEKKALLERFKILKKDFNSYSDLVNKIKTKVEEDPAMADKEVEESLKRFEKLKDWIGKKIKSLSNEVVEHEKYKQAYSDASEWVRKVRLEVQQYSDPHGEKEEAKKKKSKLDEIVKTFPEGQSLVDKVFELKDKPLQKSSPEGQDNIKQELKQLKDDWDGLKTNSEDSLKILNKCITLWEDFDNTFNKMNDWLTNCKKKVKEEEKRKTNRKPEDLKVLQNLLDETNNQKALSEELNDRCENLVDMSACTWVRDKTMQLQSEYTQILTTLQSLLSQLQKKLSDYTDFIKARDELDNWLNWAHGTIKECSGVKEEGEIKEKLETIKIVSQRLTEGQTLLGKVQEVFAKAVETAPGDEQDKLREEIARLRASWDQLNMDLNSTLADLKATLSRWEELKENQNRFEKWLEVTSQELKEPQNTKGELGEMKTAVERLKNIQGEIDQKKGDIFGLFKEAQKLCEGIKKPALLNKTKDLTTKWQKLNDTCKNLRASVESEMNDYLSYQQHLQDVEKWLLQISFQLMAHNSLYITNREQTEEQISQHKNLLNEISKYKNNLNDLTNKGQAQIKKYKDSAPNVQSTINKQLTNVQDSYDSLLNTAEQIKNRLLESLAKFKEYEDTLDSISKNLDVLEPQVLKEIDISVDDIKSAQTHLDNAKNLDNKLQLEKTRLAGAIQACEAASACVSRPSSPLEAAPPSTPEKELLLRARLEDLIDHLASRLVNLEQIIGDLEKWKKERDALNKWITEQSVVVNDWKSKPAKLRLESSKQDLNTLNNLSSQIEAKRNKALTELPSLKDNEPDMEKLLSDLQKELMVVISEKESAQKVTEGYRKKLADAHKWLDSVIKKLEDVEKGSGPQLDCYQKLGNVQELTNNINTKGNEMLENVKKLADQVAKLVNNLDSQQVEEQIKSLERRHSDVLKRIQRKTQSLEATKQGMEGIKQEVQQIRDWIKLKADDLKTPSVLGYQSKPIKDKIQNLKTLMKEVDGKQVVIDLLKQRLNNLSNDLEPKEIAQLESDLKSLTSEQSNLVASLKGELDKLDNAKNAREKFENNTDIINDWSKSKSEQVNKLGSYVPLKSSDIQQQVVECKELIADIKKFGETVLADQEKLGNSFNKDCSDEQKKKLQNVLSNTKKNYNNILKKCDEKLGKYNELIANRNQFEDKLGKCEKWLEEAQIATANPIRSPKMAVVEEQLNTYNKLNTEAKDVGDQIVEVCKDADLIMSKLNDADKLILQTQLNTVKDKHARLLGIIKDRINSSNDILEKHRDAARKIKEIMEFMEKIQNAIKELNRPVGAKVEEVQAMLNSYDKILNDLKDHKRELDNLKGKDVAGLDNALTQHDGLVKTVEDQIARLRQLLLLREQFGALIQQINTFITKYTDIVKDVEKGDDSVQDKIKKYDDIIHKIQECDALLALATDKGEQIAADGSTNDRNSITDMLGSLKQQLQQLKRSAERQREIHEKSLAAFGKLAQELDDVLDSLNNLESDVKGRPLLKREPESVDEEVEKHKVCIYIYYFCLISNFFTY